MVSSNIIGYVRYRLPGDGLKTRRLSIEKISSFDSIEDIGDRVGFLFAPFTISKDYKILLFEGHWEERVEEVSYENLNDKTTIDICSDYTSYKSVFSKFKQIIQNDVCQKLVLSRQAVGKIKGKVNTNESFKKALCDYPNAFVYELYTDKTGYWLGATPEVLLTKEGDTLTTMALAGTRPSGDIHRWSDKNIEEQAYVSSYIEDILRNVNADYRMSVPQTIKAGHVEHLCTEFSVNTSPMLNVNKLISELHPTPAICGIPKLTAHKVIDDNEGYDRKYYSGYLGPYSDDVNLYVNLRCLHISNTDESQIEFFAGGGILKESLLDEEWKETERKIRTIKDVIIIEEYEVFK